MKNFFLIFLMMTAWGHAAEPSYTYEGEVPGVFCSVCSAHVKAALGKMPGVQEVKIKLAPEGRLPLVMIKASSGTLTREDAIKALGDKTKQYDIRSLKLIQPPKH